MLAPLHAGHATAHEHIKEKWLEQQKYKTRPKTGTRRYFIQIFELITTFTNMEMTTSYLDIYEIEPRFHIPAGNDPATLWDAGLFSEGAQVNAVNFVYETPF